MDLEVWSKSCMIGEVENTVRPRGADTGKSNERVTPS